MEILYSDNKIIVCVKPRGVFSTDEEGGVPSLLRTWLGDEKASVYTVHRLDAPVGGAVVYARTRHAASDLSRDIRHDNFRKEYLAVIHGTPQKKQDTLRDFLLRDQRKKKTFAVSGPEKGAQEAALEYTLLERAEGLSLVRIGLLTGRTHQIRSQFSSRGMPLWGDRKYGAEDDGPIALWSNRLRFPHPLTGENMDFRSPPPPEEPWAYFKEELWKQN